MDYDFVLVGRTNPDPNFAHEYQGPDGALDILRTFGRDEGVAELGFEFPAVSESNGIIVFSGFVNTLAGPLGTHPAHRWNAQQVTAMAVQDREVVRNEAFANCPSATITKLPRPDLNNYDIIVLIRGSHRLSETIPVDESFPQIHCSFRKPGSKKGPAARASGLPRGPGGRKAA
jgi:hypothetical protein